MKRTPRDPRRQLFIDKSGQLRITMGLSLLPILTLLGATLAVALLGGRVLNEARSPDAEITALLPLFVALILLILSAGTLVALQAIRYSHRIAGPSFRLAQALQRIQCGDLQFRVELRDGDELQDLADNVNELLEWLGEHPPQGVTSDSLDLEELQAWGPEAQEEASRGYPATVE